MRLVNRFGYVLVPAFAMGIALCVGAPASPITLDGNLSDWGVTIPAADDSPATAWFPSIGAVWVEDDSNVGGYPGYVEPGFGGQNFDAEAAYALLDVDDMGDSDPLTNIYTLYLALVTGTDPAGQFGWGGGSIGYTVFDWGDVFVDFGGNDWDAAVAVRELGLPANGTEGTVGLYGPGTVPWWDQPAPITGSEPYVHNANADQIGTAQAAWLDDPVNDHNVAEMSLVLDNAMLQEWRRGESLVMHWTQECGNDVTHWEIPIPPPNNPVPEPATLSLLGLGLVGAVLRRRFWA